MSNSQLNSFIVEILFAHALYIREISRSPILRWNPRSSKVNFILENIRGRICPWIIMRTSNHVTSLYKMSFSFHRSNQKIKIIKTNQNENFKNAKKQRNFTISQKARFGRMGAANRIRPVDQRTRRQAEENEKKGEGAFRRISLVKISIFA